ncbi:hypothetical protein E4631_21555 [Hymenobacter sp. UV11]|uniref:hypothetical protein n=1 Tax=Hymenobacter sp. UV11 TaxID=1849735 RepID=UPI00105B3868|nr:hypothetical protein [Hymenobacter sp. UV11]TDN38883.1 hypothetical protein A8B98_22245 [Hymenobacter sp. UV11]TFZ63873.1 hypothetical protein E4631_21555 [Hymenobacter sp. UV11]
MESADETRRTLTAFNQLPPPAQLTCVWEQGYYLAARPDGAAGLVRIYQVGAFFVEIHFPASSDFVVLRAFRDPMHLQPYLDQIDIQSSLGD